MPFETPEAPPGAVRVQGEKPGRSEIDKPLRLETNPDFYLMHHPNGWRAEETENGWELLPVLKDLVIAAGHNGVELTQGDQPDSSAARTRMKDRGWVILENQDDYRVAIKVAGGWAYRLLWDVIHRYPDGTFDLQFDHKGYQDFRRKLAEDGIVQPPRPSVVAQLERRYDKRLNRRGSRLHIPGAQAAQARDEAELEGLRQAKAAVKKPRGKKAAASSAA